MKSNWRAPPKSARKKDKMTKREMLEKIAQGIVDAEVMEKATELIAAMDAEGEKRREKAAEKRAEKLEGEKELEARALEFVQGAESAVTASEVAEVIGTSSQKATIILKRLEGVEQIDIKLGKRKVKGYKLA